MGKEYERKRSPLESKRSSWCNPLFRGGFRFISPPPSCVFFFLCLYWRAGFYLSDLEDFGIFVVLGRWRSDLSGCVEFLVESVWRISKKLMILEFFSLPFSEGFGDSMVVNRQGLIFFVIYSACVIPGSRFGSFPDKVPDVLAVLGFSSPFWRIWDSLVADRERFHLSCHPISFFLFS